MASLEALGYGLGTTAVVLFGIFACAYAFYREVKQGGPDSPAFFLTARNSVKAFTIGWSFFAASMGSWALFGPPSYCLYAGVLGTIIYALFCGVPILIIAALGAYIHELVPDVLSMADFVRRRFGLLVSLFVSCIVVFNMGVGMTAEYTAVGDMFEYVLDAPRVPIVVVIGCVTMLYTAWGGLLVSIVTDLWQALTTVLVIIILVIYVCVTFREPLGPLPEPLAWDNYYGFAAIAVMPISLISATLFSEALWQRCWASENKRALMLGATLAAVAVTSAIMLLGFAGILAVWGNVYVPEGSGNTILFSLLHDNWIIVLIAIMAVTMSESAVDSFQNAIVDTIATALSAIMNAVLVKCRVGSQEAHGASEVEQVITLKSRKALWWIRSLVLILNIAPIIVSFQGYNVLQLFLLGNLICTSAVIPILGGLYCGPFSRQIFTPFSAILGVLTGLSSLFWWSAVGFPGVDYASALNTTFLVSYDYPPFLLALGFSIVGVGLGAAIEAVVRKVRHLEYPEYSLRAPHANGETEPTVEVGKEVDTDAQGEGSLLVHENSTKAE